MPPNAALFPASENGVVATAVPKTDAVFGAPKAAKSVTTLRGAECNAEEAESGLELVEAEDLRSEERE